MWGEQRKAAAWRLNRVGAAVGDGEGGEEEGEGGGGGGQGTGVERGGSGGTVED